MYATDSNESLKQKYEKENKLLNRLHGYEAAERTKFLNKYFNNKDFIKNRERNAAKFKEPLKSILKKIKFDYLGIVLLAIVIGSFAGIYTYAKKDDVSIEKQQNKNIKSVFVGLVCMLVGFGAGLATTVHSHRMIRKYDVERFYNRMAIRLFSVLKKVYPDLQDNALLNYNPESSLVITTLLMANMSDEDTKKIQSLAIALSNKDNVEKDDLQEYEAGINEAFEIVKKALDQDQDLYYSILQVYNGIVPRNFNLHQPRIKE